MNPGQADPQPAPAATPAPPRAPLPAGVLCPDCGYDLRGSVSDRCPECGFELETLRRAESQIPWSHRRQLGRFRAYWKTVWLVSRYPQRLAQEMARPVSYPDSQSFRWVTTLHAYLPILIGSVLWAVLGHVRGWGGGDLMWWVLGGLQAWTLLLLAALPGLGSYFFQPRRLSIEQQNRAIALSYYPWATLAWTPLALAPFAYGLWSWRSQFAPNSTVACFTAIGAVYFVTITLYVSHLGDLAKHAFHRTPVADALTFLLYAALACVLAGLLLALPLSAFAAAVIRDTLH